MKDKKFDAVEMKRRLQREAEEKLSGLKKEKQLKLLREKFGHLMKRRAGIHSD